MSDPIVRSILALALLAGVAALAANRIGRGPSEEPAADETASLEIAADQAEQLAALGYTEFDPAADPDLRGVTRSDPQRLAPGHVLFTDDRETAYLLDADGEVVHAWHAPPGSGRCEFARPLEHGQLVFVCVNRKLVFVDWESQLIAETHLPVHHEVAPVGDGAVLVPVHEIHEHAGGPAVFDAIFRIDPPAPPQRVWGTWEARAALRERYGDHFLDGFAPTEDRALPYWFTSDDGFDWFHMNAIEVLADTPLGRRDPRFRAGNWLVSLRNTNLIVILDQDDQSIVWSWGPGEIELQHQPQLLANGHLLLFDNGSFRGWSRVIELDPVSEEIVWEYRSDDFYSETRGSVQRLENGNTFICVSEQGRLIEITPEGEIVWEFWNPDFEKPTHRRLIYRAQKLSPARLAAFAPEGAALPTAAALTARAQTGAPR